MKHVHEDMMFDINTLNNESSNKHPSTARAGASQMILLTKGWSFRHALRSWVSRLNAMPDMICRLLQLKNKIKSIT